MTEEDNCKFIAEMWYSKAKEMYLPPHTIHISPERQARIDKQEKAYNRIHRRAYRKFKDILIVVFGLEERVKDKVCEDCDWLND